ncbi:MAG: flagellar type III secretion system pore protein FliP [Deltaproteobacteria bacterium]|nr:flagellar type III secretion system pore protein FliP [Deltaproteobacteria bacterium]
MTILTKKFRFFPSLLFVSFAILLFFLVTDIVLGQTKIPTLQLQLSETDHPDGVVPAMKIVAILTVLSIAPAILLMMTSFTRILIVLSFVRQALGTQTMPPNQVIVGLSLFLTIFTMAPVWTIIQEKALTPYLEQKISQESAVENLIAPVHKFMISETREDDLQLFYSIAKLDKPATPSEVPLSVLMPAFMISELKTAFQIGFLIYIPFLIIDMVISSILMAMGMMMLPPTVVSLPFKLVLFVLVDGWSLIVSSLVRSFQIFG